MNRTRLAVAALAALGIALQGAFLHVVVARPLAAAVHEASEPRRAATFEESIVVKGVAKAHAARTTAGGRS